MIIKSFDVPQIGSEAKIIENQFKILNETPEDNREYLSQDPKRMKRWLGRFLRHFEEVPTVIRKSCLIDSGFTQKGIDVLIMLRQLSSPVRLLGDVGYHIISGSKLEERLVYIIENSTWKFTICDEGQKEVSQ